MVINWYIDNYIKKCGALCFVCGEFSLTNTHVFHGDDIFDGTYIIKQQLCKTCSKLFLTWCREQHKHITGGVPSRGDRTTYFRTMADFDVRIFPPTISRKEIDEAIRLKSEAPRNNSQNTS